MAGEPWRLATAVEWARAALVYAFARWRIVGLASEQTVAAYRVAWQASGQVLGHDGLSLGDFAAVLQRGLSVAGFARLAAQPAASRPHITGQGRGDA